MTIPLGKPVRREVLIRRGIVPTWHIVSMTPAGLELRVKGYRFTMLVPWPDVLARAEHLAGEHRHREQLRARAIARSSRARA